MQPASHRNSHTHPDSAQTQHTTSIATTSAPYTRLITTSALALQSFQELDTHCFSTRSIGAADSPSCTTLVASARNDKMLGSLMNSGVGCTSVNSRSDTARPDTDVRGTIARETIAACTSEYMYSRVLRIHQIPAYMLYNSRFLFVAPKIMQHGC